MVLDEACVMDEKTFQTELAISQGLGQCNRGCLDDIQLEHFHRIISMAGTTHRNGFEEFQMSLFCVNQLLNQLASSLLMISWCKEYPGVGSL